MRQLVLLLIALGLLGCTIAPPQPGADGSTSLLRLPASDVKPAADTIGGEAVGSAIAAYARQMLGVPYAYGGRSPEGFDCSGLVQYSHGRAGIDVPRTSRAQLRAARRITLQQARAGDLLFFRSRNYSHVAVYLGGNRFVHAPSTGKHVTQASLTNDYYRTHLVAVGRLH